MRHNLIILILAIPFTGFSQKNQPNPCISGFSEDSIIVSVADIIKNPNISVCDSTFEKIVYYDLYFGINGVSKKFGRSKPVSAKISKAELNELKKLSDSHILSNCIVVTNLKYLNHEGDTLTANNYKLFLTTNTGMNGFSGRLKIKTENWKNGKIMNREYVSENKKIRSETFYPTGILRTRYNYSYFKEDTIRKEYNYFNNGNLLGTNTQVNSLDHGELKVYYKNGRIKRISANTKGIRTEETLFTRKGKTKEYSILNEEKNEVTMTKYRLFGLLVSETVYPYSYVTRKW